MCIPSSLPDVIGDAYPPNDCLSEVTCLRVDRDEDEHSGVFILVRHLSLVDGSRSNYCVYKVPLNQTQMRWKGPMAVVRGKLVEGWPDSSRVPIPIDEFEDVRPTDLEVALTYLR